MRHQIRIFAIAVALALCIGMAAPAQAWPGGDHGTTPSAGWWQSAVDTFATLFGLERPTAKQVDGSPCIDPGGRTNPVCPAPRPALQLDGSCSIDPAGNTVCHPGP